MQLTEASDLGVRSAIYRFRRNDSGLEFMLFPMIHVGSREYYAAVRARLDDCDVIFAEGVASRHAALLTLAYGAVAKVKDLHLVTQRALDLRPLSSKVVHTDVTGPEFENGWSHIPLRERLILTAAVPMAAAYMYLFGTKEFVAKHCGVEHLPSREEVLRPGESFEKLDELVIGQRDAKLLRHIEDFHQCHGSETKVVGIVWGAGHMRSVVRLLLGKLSYRVAKAEWITVFEY